MLLVLILLDGFFASFVDACHRASPIVQIQATLSEKALELLALPDNDVPKLLLDIEN
ncbi:hypothetical protein D0Y65_026166 [Glycine soja]|uniref:Uncharacterized protein n=1 Tax=Glycine soja TaxID=3848 RepID=A0A445IIM0_GLYSO|nr:hypothetical protein D0Y65_026166 [Glycine soja]